MTPTASKRYFVFEDGFGTSGALVCAFLFLVVAILLVVYLCATVLTNSDFEC